MLKKVRILSFCLVASLTMARGAYAGTCYSEWPAPPFGFYFVDCDMECSEVDCEGYCGNPTGGGVAYFDCDPPSGSPINGMCVCNN